MKEKRTIRDYVDDALKYMSLAQKYLKDVPSEDFYRNDEKQNATIHALEIVGEAARNIPRSVRDKYSDLPWKDIVGMRQKIAHDYFGVDLKLVWNTVKKDIPAQQPVFEKIKQDIAQGKLDKELAAAQQEQKQVQSSEQTTEIKHHRGRHF